jgi:hypothetical protein
MKKLLMLTLVLLVCINLMPGASGQFNPRWVPAQSKWVIHFDQALFSQTKLFSIVDKSWKDDKKSIQSEILDELNIDLHKDLKGLTVIGLDRQGNKGNQVMVILQGNFDQNRIAKRLKEKEKNLKSSKISGYTVLSWDKGSNLFFPSPDVMVFCEGRQGMEEMVNLQKGSIPGLSQTSPLFKILSEAPQSAFVRAAVVDVSDLTKYAPKTMVLDSASVGFFMALEARDNLSMLLKLVTESAQKAQQMQQIITGLKALASLKAFDKDDDVSEIMELLNGIAITTEGSRLVMSFDYPVDKIGQLVHKMGDKKPVHRHRKSKNGGADESDDL